MTTDSPRLSRADSTRITQAFAALPYGYDAFRHLSKDQVNGSDTVSVDGIAIALDALAETLRGVAERNDATTGERDLLRHQRDAVRAFLGTAGQL